MWRENYTKKILSVFNDFFSFFKMENFFSQYIVLYIFNFFFFIFKKKKKKKF